MRVRSPGWPPEGPAGGDGGRWQSALAPTKEQQAQPAAVCQFATDPPPQEAPKSNCGPTAIWMSFALRELWELPAWLGALHPQPSPSGEWPVGLC